VLRGKDVNDIIELKRQGLPISQISQLTGYSRPTIRKYLDNPAAPRYGPRPLKGSKVEPFKPYLEQRLAAGVWNAVVLLAEIKARGYEGEYTALKDYLRPLRKQARTVAVRRFETPPGHQAQLDWGELGHLETAGSSGGDGNRKTLYGFVFTLGHSRAVFADIATDTRIATLLRLHEAAFAELGGVPREILYDRMKTVVLGTDERGETKWNPVFMDFARYWGFTPRACRAYRPQTKGKVESGVGYLRKNFLCGREASGFTDLRGQLRTWVWRKRACPRRWRTNGFTARRTSISSRPGRRRSPICCRLSPVVRPSLTPPRRRAKSVVTPLSRSKAIATRFPGVSPVTRCSCGNRTDNFLSIAAASGWPSICFARPERTRAYRLLPIMRAFPLACQSAVVRPRYSSMLRSPIYRSSRYAPSSSMTSSMTWKPQGRLLMNSSNGSNSGSGSLLERLHGVLGDLKLSEADTLLEAHLQRASQGDRPYADFLLDLLEAEARARQEMRFAQSLKRSRLPAAKTLEQFDFAFQPSIDQSQIRELRTLRFVHEAGNVVLLGPPGVGASGLARARRTLRSR